MQTNTQPLEELVKEIVGKSLEESIGYHMDFLQDNVTKAVNLAIANALTGMLRGLVDSHSEVDSPQPTKLLRKDLITESLRAKAISEEDPITIPDFQVISGVSNEDIQSVLPAMTLVLSHSEEPMTLADLFKELVSKHKLYVVRLSDIIQRVKLLPNIDLYSPRRGLYTVQHKERYLNPSSTVD